MINVLGNAELLKEWLLATGRQYMCLHAVDMVDALEFPDEVVVLQRLLNQYGAHRSALVDECASTEEETVQKSDTLTVEEKTQLAVQLIGEVIKADSGRRQCFRDAVDQ